MAQENPAGKPNIPVVTWQPLHPWPEGRPQEGANSNEAPTRETSLMPVSPLPNSPSPTAPPQQPPPPPPSSWGLGGREGEGEGAQISLIKPLRPHLGLIWAPPPPFPPAPMSSRSPSAPPARRRSGGCAPWPWSAPGWAPAAPGPGCCRAAPEPRPRLGRRLGAGVGGGTWGSRGGDRAGLKDVCELIEPVGELIVVKIRGLEWTEFLKI